MAFARAACLPGRLCTRELAASGSVERLRSRRHFSVRASDSPNGVDAVAANMAKAGEPLMAKFAPKTVSENMLPNISTNTEKLTTNAGTPVVSNKYSLTAGPRGPVLLEDVHLLEKLAQFDREKTPERVVHARGMAAKGYFETTADVSDLTMADFLSEPGKKTQVTARLSTVTHERGSPESLRDVRGFSVKFYTNEGNWDFVGNNMPVFFLRDGMQFPDLVHALRPNPKNHIQEGWRILDFFASHPEGINNLLWLLDDTGIPKNWRHLEGYGINTFKLINSQGRETLVKFHWRPTIGAAYMTNEEAVHAGELNARHSHATQDLFNAIAAGNFPEWKFYWQTMPADVSLDTLDFDPLDCTKEWPEEDFPLQEVGKLVLDTNISNFQAESEQIAFSPGQTIPGIGLSDDKVLQTRAFSYGDTQRYRIGVNYQQLPVNMPKCPFHNNHNDGIQQWNFKDEEVNYFPSVVEKTGEYEPQDKINWSNEHIQGERVKVDYPKQVDEYKQPGERYRKVIKPDSERNMRFVTNIVGWMADPKTTPKLRDIWMGHWAKVDEDLASQIAAKVQEKMTKMEHSEKVGATLS